MANKRNRRFMGAGVVLAVILLSYDLVTHGLRTLLSSDSTFSSLATMGQGEHNSDFSGSQNGADRWGMRPPAPPLAPLPPNHEFDVARALTFGQWKRDAERQVRECLGTAGNDARATPLQPVMFAFRYDQQNSTDQEQRFPLVDVRVMSDKTPTVAPESQQCLDRLRNTVITARLTPDQLPKEPDSPIIETMALPL